MLYALSLGFSAISLLPQIYLFLLTFFNVLGQILLCCEILTCGVFANFFFFIVYEILLRLDQTFLFIYAVGLNVLGGAIEFFTSF